MRFRSLVDRIITWSAKWSKIKKLDDIDFNKLVSDAALRDPLGYNIPENKTLLNMKGRAKKRVANPETVVTEKVAKKKKVTPLIACPPKRVPPMRVAKRPIKDISREEMSEVESKDVFADIEGYTPKKSLVRETVILPTFWLSDEITLSQSLVQSLNSLGQSV